MVVWTKNSKVQFGVVKNNGLVDQVKNGFGMGIQTVPFQFELNTEEKIKDLTKATIRCIPLDRVEEQGKCILTGMESAGRVLFAKAY